MFGQEFLGLGGEPYHIVRLLEPVALVFGPNVAPETMLHRVAALDGRIVRLGGSDKIVVATFDKDLALGDLWGQGIWFGLDPLFFGGCSASSSLAQSGRES